MIKQDLSNSIIEAIRYFSFFSYPPTIEEIHRFLKKKTYKGHLVSILEKMEKESLVKGYKSENKAQSTKHEAQNMEDGTWNMEHWAQNTNHETIKNFKLKTKNSIRYTLGEYSIGKENQSSNVKGQKYLEQSVILSEAKNLSRMRDYPKRYKISQDKIKKIQNYIEKLAKFPQIKLIGLSGSVAMMNADEDHDVDLFIITAKNKLWTARFITILTAQFMNLRRMRGVKKAQDKVCLNLFFDESGLKIPKFKQNEYVAHEILQMKPLVSKDKIYERFLEDNSWVYKIFPNDQSVILGRSKATTPESDSGLLTSFVARMTTFSGNLIEFLLKIIQLFIIKRHQTTEIVTDKQLWFFPDDFEKKLTL